MRACARVCVCVRACVRACVYSLTPGQPPRLGLHGQRTHHSPHVCSCRRGNKRVCVLKSVSILLSRVRRLVRTHTLPSPCFLFSSSSPSLSSSLNGCFWQKPLSPSSLLHAFSLHLTALLLSLPFFSPPHSLPLSISLPPISLFFSRGCSLPPFVLLSCSLYIPPTYTRKLGARRSISDSV